MKKYIIRHLSLFMVILMILSIHTVGFSAIGNSIKNFKQVSATDKSITVNWNPVFGQTRYSIDIKESSKNSWKNIYSNPQNGSYTINNLKPATKYDIRISTGSFSATTKAATAPKNVNNFKQIGATTKSITLSWSPAKKASSYRISFWNLNNKKEVKKAITNKTTVKIKGLNNKKQFNNYVVIRPGINVNGKTFYNNDFYFYQTLLYDDDIKLKPNKPKVSIEDYIPAAGKLLVKAYSSNAKVDGFQFRAIGADKKKKVWDRKSYSLTYESCWLDKIHSNQRYTIQSRCYVNINGKKVFGAWSKGKKVN